MKNGNAQYIFYSTGGGEKMENNPAMWKAFCLIGAGPVAGCTTVYTYHERLRRAMAEIVDEMTKKAAATPGARVPTS